MSFRENYDLFGKEVFVMYFHKYIVVPISLMYFGKNEFHWMLEINNNAIMVMNRKEFQKYLNRLSRKRSKMHEKTLWIYPD